jgi:hypothetical protein
MGLSKDSQTQLFQGLVEHNFRKFWAVNQQLLEAESGHAICKYLPVRFVFANLKQPYVQKPIPPLDPQGTSFLSKMIANYLASNQLICWLVG